MRESDKTIKKLDAKIAAMWRDVECLRNTVAEKTKHMDLLFSKQMTPIMVDDTPVHTWRAICEYMRTIAELKEFRRNLLGPQ